MTDDQINVAIAEACGTLRGHYCGHCREERDITNKNSAHQHGNEMFWFCNYCDGPLHQDMPNYSHDLNAMHEAEKTLSDRQRKNFVNDLWIRVNPDLATQWDEASSLAFFDYINATAHQRAEAFLRTIGKWKE